MIRLLASRRRAWRPSHILAFPVRKRLGDSMTIAIGLMAQTEQSADQSLPATSHLFLCADTMATYATLGGVAITSHQSQGKIYELPNDFFLAFSDDYYWAHLVAMEIHGRLLANVDFSSDGVKDLIKAEIRQAFAYAYT